VTNGRITGRIYHIKQSNVTSNSREHCCRLSRRYWGLNDPLIYTHRSRNSQCFSMGHKTHKIALLPWWSQPHLTRFPGTTQVRSSKGTLISSAISVKASTREDGCQNDMDADVYAGDGYYRAVSRLCDQQTDRQTDRHTDRPSYMRHLQQQASSYAMHAMQPKVLPSTDATWYWYEVRVQRQVLGQNILRSAYLHQGVGDSGCKEYTSPP